MTTEKGNDSKRFLPNGLISNLKKGAMVINLFLQLCSSNTHIIINRLQALTMFLPIVFAGPKGILTSAAPPIKIHAGCLKYTSARIIFDEDKLISTSTTTARTGSLSKTFRASSEKLSPSILLGYSHIKMINWVLHHKIQLKLKLLTPSITLNPALLRDSLKASVAMQ